MLRFPSPLRSWLELILVAGTFTILLVYTYALFFRLPYAGFEWDVGQGLITDVWSAQNPGLAVGDRLLSVNNLSIERYRSNLRLELFPEDDDVGLQSNFTDDLRQLLERRQFGLAGMYERADLVGAQLVIQSIHNQGTRVEIEWPIAERN